MKLSHELNSTSGRIRTRDLIIQGQVPSSFRCGVSSNKQCEMSENRYEKKPFFTFLDETNGHVLY